MPDDSRTTTLGRSTPSAQSHPPTTSPPPIRWAKVPAGAAHHPDLSDRAVHVYAVLARHADRAGRCWPSRETIAAAAGCSVRSVDRALGELAAAGLIERTARGNGAGGRTSTLYTLTTAAGEPFAAVPEPALAGSSRAVRLYARLDLMADRNGVAEPSRRRLAALLACSTDSVDRALTELAEAGVVIRLPAAGKAGRLRLPHRPARPAAPVDSPAPATPAPSARVAAKVPQRWQGNESSLNENPDDTRGNCNREPGWPAATPLSSGSSAPSATRATAVWTRATCHTYAVLVAAGRTDLTNRHAFVAVVARQAAGERADRLAELHAAGLDPDAAAAALAADGPATPPPQPPRREPRPLGDPGCPVCEGGGWTPDLDGLMIRCACTAPNLDLEPAAPPPAPPILDPGETALDPAEALARLRAIRRRRTLETVP